MLENVELSAEDRRRLKIFAAQEDKTMKDLLLSEANEIIQSDAFVPSMDRADDYVTLIIEVPEDFKDEIRRFCREKDIRIRDLWVESCNRVLGDFNE